MRQHLGARKGNYMLTMPFFIPILVGFAALSVDISYINMTQTQVQHVADAASHAAYVAYRSTNDTSVGDAAALYILDNNLVGNEKGKLGVPIQYGEWDPDNVSFDPNSASINAARAIVVRNTIKGNSVDLFFAPILGYDTADVAALGVTAGRSREIIIIQDVSCSFGADDQGPGGNQGGQGPNGQDIINSRAADVAFLDYLHDHPSPDDKFGMTVFGGRAWYPKVYELSDVAAHYDAIRVEVNKLEICKYLPPELWASPNPNPTWQDTKCGTAQARGIILARDQFIEHGDQREYQAAIIVSDGQPTHGLLQNQAANNAAGRDAAEADAILAQDQLWGKDSDGNDATVWNYSAYGCGDQNAPGGSGPWTSGMTCNDKAYSTTFHGGVHTWSVFFGPAETEPNTPLRDWMEDNMVDGDGKAYATTDSTELTQIMTEIASSIPVVLTD